MAGQAVGEKRLPTRPSPGAGRYNLRPRAKRHCGPTSTRSSGPTNNANLLDLPRDVVSKCLSFLSSSKDRLPLQLTCREFKDETNSDDMLRRLDLVGNLATGEGSILCSTGALSGRAIERLQSFCLKANKDAIYLLALMAIYCFDDVTSGVPLLRIGTKIGCPRCMYELSFTCSLDIDRESTAEREDRRNKCLERASQAGYVPATAELIEQPAGILGRHGLHGTDFPSLVDHLRRYRFPHILKLGHLGLTIRTLRSNRFNKRICGNPLCGRWAWRASSWRLKWLRERRDSEGRDMPPSFCRLVQNTATDVASHFGVAASALSMMRTTSYCGQCRNVEYCSRSCQVVHWLDDHHHHCRPQPAA